MKKLVMVMLAVFFAPLAFAQFHFLPTEDDHLQQWVEYSIAGSGNYGLERNQAFGGMAYAFSYGAYKGFAGFQLTDTLSDITFVADCLPVWLTKKNGLLQLGGGLLYHGQKHTAYTEHDIIGNFALDWRTQRSFYLRLHAGLSLKLTNLPVFHRLIQKWDPQAEFVFGKVFPIGTEIYYSHALHTRFRYPAAFTPTYTLGIAQHIQQHIRVGIEGAVTFTDQYATVNYLESLIVRLTGRILF